MNSQQCEQEKAADGMKKKKKKQLMMVRETASKQNWKGVPTVAQW